MILKDIFRKITGVEQMSVVIHLREWTWKNTVTVHVVVNKEIKKQSKNIYAFNIIWKYL